MKQEATITIIEPPKSIRFWEGNKIEYGKDHRFWETIPADVNFYVWRVSDSNVELVADGYGVLKEHNEAGIFGRYGSGSLHLWTFEGNISPELMEQLKSICVNKSI